MRINAFIVNRNLYTTTKNTVDFLLKDERIKVFILDQGSTYEPCLNYYKNCEAEVVYLKNIGPYSPWSKEISKLYNEEPFIVTDPDCDYENIPKDWLDKMIYTLDNSKYFKVGFSIEVNDIPKTNKGKKIIDWEKKYWEWYDEKFDGYVGLTDTTFCLYRQKSVFAYNSIRLNRPYTIKHIPWYLNELNEEWSYYKNNCKFGHWIRGDL